MLVLQKGLILPVPMYGGSYFFIQPFFLQTLNEKLTSTFSLFCSTLGTGGWKLVLQSFIL